MKRFSWKHSALLLAPVALASALCLPAVCQSSGLIPAGNSSLPAGQYMLTNIKSGQSLYVEIDNSGKLFAQDPRAMNITVTGGSSAYGSSGGTGYGSNSSTGGSTNNNTGIGGLIPGGTGTVDGQQKPGIWGGILRQGVESILNKQAPQQQ